MAQFFTDFSEYSTGAVPADWTVLWDTSNHAWTVQSLAGATGGKVLQVDSGGFADPGAISWNDPGSVNGDVEIVYRWQRPDAGMAVGDLVAMGVVHGGGSSGSEDGYATSWVRSATSTYRLRLHEYTAGASATLATDATPPGGSVAPTVATWYWTRLQRTGTTIRSRTWVDGDAEPGTWTLSGTDATRSSGWVGFGQESSTQTINFDVFGVGTGGDAAPTESVDTGPVIPVFLHHYRQQGIS